MINSLAVFGLLAYLAVLAVRVGTARDFYRRIK